MQLLIEERGKEKNNKKKKAYLEGATSASICILPAIKSLHQMLHI